MQIKPKVRRNLIVGGVLFAFVATPSFALFGIGDIVFDPTSYASLVSQLTTLKTQYSMLKNNLEHFSLKSQWKTAVNKAKYINVPNLFGETNGLDIALNTNNPSASKAAWGNTTVTMNSGAVAYLSTQPANSAQKSQLAMIEVMDATSPACITAVGTYNAAVTANATAEQNLQESQTDDDDDTNSEVEQLNLMNAAQAQQLVEMKQQGMLHACLAQQMAVSNMQQRNAAANDLNTWGFVQQQRQMSDANPANGSATWTTYLP